MLERSIDYSSPNSVLLIHHEFEGVLEMYSLIFCIFSFYKGLSAIWTHMYVYGIWPPVNVSCSFPTKLILTARSR
jgi:hypothetical protein